MMDNAIMSIEPLLEVKNLSVSLKTGRQIISGVNFTLKPQECLAIVGESGAGKSISLLGMLGLLDRQFLVQGSAKYQGVQFLNDRKLTLQLRGAEIFLMVQQPMTAFDPLVRMGKQLLETIKVVYPKMPKAAAHQQMIDVLKRLQFDDPESVLQRYPSELSGGMLQRLMIACALLVKPKLIIADEPTSALDVVAAQEVIKSFQAIIAEHHTSLIVITHDLGAANALADHFLVMKKGQVVESGGKEVLRHPQHEYTQYLIQTRQMLMKNLPPVSED